MPNSRSQIVITELAELDLDAIWSYTCQTWSENQADIYYGEIDRAIKRIANGEISGKICDARPGYFKYKINKHVVYYTIQNDCLKVIRILHGRMDESVVF